ncbi:50S ribosome-binding GTPase [Carpediemonas membranifera]|uniref:50S ribosome-binding GTPase n=1 Tax=Carpediemonas membranifera TaxID=201153 RepID=A0A8J6B493_9EUKA|nr:50S ribosome-binding GTPase [Carpediemonas membranifera]|eukprot:KAG9393994.1 50S ribosome-binding GTPase [Carpediemonas membranifera]
MSKKRQSGSAKQQRIERGRKQVNKRDMGVPKLEKLGMKLTKGAITGAKTQQKSISELASHAAELKHSFDRREHQREQAALNDTRDERSLDRGAYYDKLHRVLEEADVILEVLDARDPMGCRCFDIEQRIRAMFGFKKHIILVLNKIDLVPNEALRGWVRYLKTQFPTMLFKAGQVQGKHASIKQMHHAQAMTVKDAAFGLEEMRATLGKLANIGDNTKVKITVGVIGYPNVGKSSLINSICREVKTGVGGAAGFTTDLKRINLTKHITVIDSPGVVFSHADTEVDIILRNCVRPELIKDPVHVAQTILQRCNHLQLLRALRLAPEEAEAGPTVFDQIGQYTDKPDEAMHVFFQYIAQRKGMFKLGGLPDMNRVARDIVDAWLKGRIQYYVPPPELPEHIAQAQATRVDTEAKVITELLPELDIDALIGGGDEGFVAYTKETAPVEVEM